MSAPASSLGEVTERYYDSDDADRFYFHVWGGEDIHIGLYEPGDSIAAASRRTVERMARALPALSADSVVLDLGSGYGGSARWLARHAACRVTCLNLSRTQNARNIEANRAAGLSGRIEVLHGNFEDVPCPDASVDVVWSQDAFLHTSRRERVLAEARRVLRPGGRLVFTDPMQADDCPPGVLQPVLDRIHLESLGSFERYERAAGELGLEKVAIEPLTEHLVRHYGAVRRELTHRADELAGIVSRAYIERMLEGLGHWVRAGEAGYLAWGILCFRAPA